MFVSRRNRDERGATAVMFALLSLVLLGVAALGTDVGNMVSRRTMSQTQADFAALAAAQDLTRTARAGSTPSARVVTSVRDYLNHNQPQDDDSPCWRNEPADCVTSAHLTDGDLANGEVRYVTAGLQVVAPEARVDFTLASIFGSDGTTVDAQATVNVYSGGQRVMPMFTVPGCDYGRQTLTDPASGQVVPPPPPTLAHDGETNTTVLSTATMTDPAGAPVSELPRGSSGYILSLTASKWSKTGAIGFFRGDNPDPLLVATQDHFWASNDDPDGPDSDTLPRTDLSPGADPANWYTNNPSSTVRAVIPDPVSQTEGVWYVRVQNSTSSGLKWSARSEAKAIRVGGAVLECNAGSIDGNFGTLKFPRTDVPSGSELPVNIAVGLQRPLTPGIHEWAVENPLLAGTCVHGVNGAIESSGTNLRPATNCVDTDTGLPANVATQGLVTGADGHPGMLTTRPTKAGCDPAGGSSDRTVRIGSTNYSFNNDVLTCYLTDGTTSLATITNPTYAGPAVLDEDIYSAPRFLWVPVLSRQPTSGGSLRYSIIDFRPAFITDEESTAAAIKGSRTATSNNGLIIPSNNITSISVVFFDVDALPTDGDFPTIDFLGVGTPIVRLVE